MEFSSPGKFVVRNEGTKTYCEKDLIEQKSDILQNKFGFDQSKRAKRQ